MCPPRGLVPVQCTGFSGLEEGVGVLCPCLTPGTQGTHTTVTHLQEKARGREKGLQQANPALWPLGNTADLGSSDGLVPFVSQDLTGI